MKPKELLRDAARRILGKDLYSHLRLRSLQLWSNLKAFGEIYERNLWVRTRRFPARAPYSNCPLPLRPALPRLLTELNAGSLLDASCGDSTG